MQERQHFDVMVESKGNAVRPVLGKRGDGTFFAQDPEEEKNPGFIRDRIHYWQILNEETGSLVPHICADCYPETENFDVDEWDRHCVHITFPSNRKGWKEAYREARNLLRRNRFHFEKAH